MCGIVIVSQARVKQIVCGIWEVPTDGRPWALGWTHPYEFAKSKNRRRFDVSRNSRPARSDAKVSPNDIEVRANDIEWSRSVDFRSHSVDFRPVVSADAKS